MNDTKTHKKIENISSRLNSLRIVNLKIYLWISMLMINVAAVFAQEVETSGLFSAATGTTFITLGIFIIIIFFIGDQIFQRMKSKK